MVLLFPPVNNFRRFLIHQTCENFRNKYDLFTFSVGQGPLRRTVVCFKNQLLDPQKYADTTAAINFETRQKNTTPKHLKSWRSDNRYIVRENFTKNNFGTDSTKRNRKMGAEANIIDANKREVYRPPALRNHANEAIKQIARETETSFNIERKQTTSLSSPTAANSSTTTTSISCNNSPIHGNENININISLIPPEHTSLYKSQQPQQVDEQTEQPRSQQPTRRERRPDRAVYIPRARRSQTTPPNAITTQIPTPAKQQQQLQPQSSQQPAIAPTINDKSKSVNQQLPITLDDTITALVNEKPPSKTDKVGKINSCGIFNSACSTATTIKKKEKLNNENKESREQRREQRLSRKLSFTSTQHDHNNEKVENVNECSKNIISNKEEGNEKTKQTCIVKPQQINSLSPLNDVNNFNQLNDNINNLSKASNCDSNEELILNTEQQQSFVNTTLHEIESLEKNQLNNIEIANTSTILNTFESQFLHIPAQSIEINSKSTNNTSTENNVTATNIFITSSNTNTMPKPLIKPKSNKLKQIKLPHLCIEDVASQQSPKICDIEEQELQRASKEINRSNRRIIKQTFISDVLQIPGDVNEENESKSKVAATTTQVDSNTDDDEEEEEDNWENMYNDSGDCLDPKIMQELTASVGKCKIELPKMDYSAYLTKQSILNDEEFPHVLEVSNFPVEFKNQDLLMVFSQYKESGFDIKWVDDTHALAVFSSSRIAAEVLTMGHPFVVLKPLAEATIESRLKAKKCAASLQPYRPRPETCAALARRLVTGALGVRLKTAAAERENEKRVLREAKERKLLAAKQRDELWEC